MNTFDHFYTVSIARWRMLLQYLFVENNERIIVSFDDLVTQGTRARKPFFSEFYPSK